MPNIAGVGVARDVGQELVLGCVGVPGAHVPGLHCFEVLEGAEFVGHFGGFCFLGFWIMGLAGVFCCLSGWEVERCGVRDCGGKGLS